MSESNGVQGYDDNQAGGADGRAGRADVSLRESEERLRLATERLDAVELACGALIYDFGAASGKIWRSGGMAQVLGWLPGEIPATIEGWTALCHPQDAKRFQSTHFSDDIKKDDHYALEYRVRHKDGHYIWVLDSGRVFHNASGEMVRITGATIDVTARKSAEAAREYGLVDEVLERRPEESIQPS